MSYQDTKLGKLENKVGTAAFQMAVAYAIEQGFKHCSEITDKEIESTVGNQLMTTGFAQSLLKTAREIAKCSLWEELFPYVRKFINLAAAPAKNLDLYKEDFRRDSWEEVLHDLDIEDSKSKCLKLIVVDIEEE